MSNYISLCKIEFIHVSEQNDKLIVSLIGKFKVV